MGVGCREERGKEEAVAVGEVVGGGGGGREDGGKS